MFAILVNLFVMMTNHAGQTAFWDDLQLYSNIAFTAIFVLEMCAKWVVLGLRPYFSHSWNIFDCVATLAAVLGVILDLTLKSSAGFLTMLRILRVVRISRCDSSRHCFCYVCMPQILWM